MSGESDNIKTPAQALELLKSDYGYGLIGVLILVIVDESGHIMAQDIAGHITDKVAVSYPEIQHRIVDLIKSGCLNREKPRRPLTITQDGRRVLRSMIRFMDSFYEKAKK